MATASRTGRRRKEPKTDALPKYQVYQDDGCEVSPSCLRCPLPVCKYDDPGILTRQRRQRRDDQVRQLIARGGKTATVAHEVGLSTRTVARIKAGAR